MVVKQNHSLNQSTIFELKSSMKFVLILQTKSEKLEYSKKILQKYSFTLQRFEKNVKFYFSHLI